MSAISDVVSALEAFSTKVTEGVDEAGGVGQQIAEAIEAAEQLGAEAVITGLGEVSERVDTILGMLNGAVEAIGEAITHTQGLAEGT